MKKIICFILVFIIVLTPLNFVKATEAIELTQASFDLLNNGVDLLSYSGSVPYGFLPFVFSSEKNYQNVIEDLMQKQDIFIIDGNANIQIRPLTQNEYGLLENAYVYDDNGDVVSLSDLYFGTVDNGYFTEKFYCKNDGSIVYQDSLKENPYIDVKFGGSEKSYLDWENAYNTLFNSISQNEFNYSLDEDLDLSNNNISVFYSIGQKGTYGNIDFVTIYVPNAYSDDMTVSDGTYPSTIYYNQGFNPYVYKSGSIPSSTQNNPTYKGKTYYRSVNFGTAFNQNRFITYSEFGSVPRNSNLIYIIDYNGFTYDSTLAESFDLGDIISYKSISNIGDSLDLSKGYSYNAVSDYADSISGITATINPSFDNTDVISAINYPLIYEIEDSVSDVEIPFPDSVVIDDSPVIDYPLEDTIDPSLITSNIPIISDLKNKFPFSIPWDIANLLKGLEAQRTTPYIDTDVTIPGVNYTWHIEYDLSDFDGTAELFRSLFLIAFIIGLAYFSYDHFFGS